MNRPTIAAGAVVLVFVLALGACAAGPPKPARAASGGSLSVLSLGV